MIKNITVPKYKMIVADTQSDANYGIGCRAGSLAGKFLVAWHPTASEENERTTVVIENETYGKVLYRQIAGALAKRIVNYAKQNDKTTQGEESGFIKFGSRVDLFLPLNTKIKVQLNQKVRGGESVIAEVNE